MELKPLFKSIADAIREKDGTAANITASTFPDRIRAIPSGGLGGVILESIEIITPPTKTIYLTGESFDPAGMVVSAKFSDGQSMYVDNANLTFYPSGPLQEGTTSVTVNFQFGLKMVSASQGIAVGASFEWWSPKMTSNSAPVPYMASASSNSQNISYQPYLAFDGVPNTSTTIINSWSSAENAKSAYVQLDVGSVIDVYGLRINASYNAYGIMTPDRFYFQTSEDGNEWRTAAEFSSIKWPPIGEYREFFFDIAAKFKVCRIGANDVSGGETVNGRISYGDIQFYVLPSSANMPNE